MEQSRWMDEGVSSVKVHHKPGGASNFSLSHSDAPDDRFSQNHKVGGGT